MRKIVFLLFALWSGLLTAAAQDLIVKTDASQVEAKVVEVSPDEVRYKRFSNPDGPTYVLPVAEISYIQYANGERETYNKVSEAAAPAAGTAESAAPSAAPSDRYVLKQYEIGELYDENGLRGVVCALSEDRQHGLILSLEELYLHWSEFRKPDLRVIGTVDRADGMANMEIVERYIAENGLSWDDFPAFKWCREQGDGWYLPAIDEVLTIGHNYNGGLRKNDRQARNKFNNTLKNAGGKRMDRMVYYFSSTEKDEKMAYTSHMSIEPPYVVEIPKYNKFLVRAVHKF